MPCPTLLPWTVLGLLLAPSVAGQTVRYLQTDVDEVRAGSELRVHLTEERAGRWRRGAWPGNATGNATGADTGADTGTGSDTNNDIEWLFLRSAGTQKNLHEAAPDDEAGESFGMPVAEPGICMVGLQPRARVVNVPGPELREFLALRLSPETLPAGWREQLPAAPVRVWHIESSKLLVRVRGAEDGSPPSATAQSKAGQPVEIRLLADPTLVPLKHDLPLRVYLPGPRSAGILVLARHADSGRVQSFFTDPRGTGFFTLTGPGWWTVEVHAVRPLPEDDTADWELHTATLSFQVPARDNRKAVDR